MSQLPTATMQTCTIKAGEIFLSSPCQVISDLYSKELVLQNLESSNLAEKKNKRS